MRSSWKPSGPTSFHQARKSGCHLSSARCSLGLPSRLTLLGMLSNMAVAPMGPSLPFRRPAPLLRAAPVELRAVGFAVQRERALFARGVGTGEDPVLPGGKAREDLGLHR